MTLAKHVHVRTQTIPRAARPVAPKPKTVTQIARRTAASPKQINDVVRVRHPSLVLTPRPARQPIAVQPIAAKKLVMDVSRHVTHVKAHKTQPAQTLMRSAVKRPTVSLKRRANAQTRTDILIKSPQFEVTPKPSIQVIDPKRHDRASKAAKSNRISHFAPEQASWFRQQVKSPVASAAAVTPEHHLEYVQPSRSMDIFQKALATATAHEQLPLKQKRVHKAARPLHHHTASLVALSVAVLVIAGFFAYQHKANITLRFANAKAGFHATLPSYQPSGYAAGRFHYSTGSVAVEYNKSGTSRAYTLSQSRPTDPSRLASTLAPKGVTYQTLQQGNNTIYIYSNGNAAWLKAGTLYQIKSNGNLNTSDILSIATSV